MGNRFFGNGRAGGNSLPFGFIGQVRCSHPALRRTDVGAKDTRGETWLAAPTAVTFDGLLNVVAIVGFFILLETFSNGFI